MFMFPYDKRQSDGHMYMSNVNLCGCFKLNDYATWTDPKMSHQQGVNPIIHPGAKQTQPPGQQYG